MTVLGALIISAGVFVTWVITANDVIGFGVYQNSTVVRIDQIDQNYVKNEVHRTVADDLKRKTEEARDLQAKLDASTAQEARLSELVRFERQNSQARAIACQAINSRIISVKSEQNSIESSIARRYRPTGIWEAPSKDVPLEDALNSDRRYSSLLQEQILELTREMRAACGYLSPLQETGI